MHKNHANYKAQHPKHWEWIEANRFDNNFARNCYTGLIRFHCLTPKMHARVGRELIK